MTFLRWLPTFLGFPLGGLLAIETVGSIDDPLSGAAAGLIAGTAIGAAQWLALRTRGIGPRWVAQTAAAMAAGTGLAAAVTGAGTGVGDVMVSGLIAGTTVGAAQALLLPRGPRAAASWTVATGASWALGWLATSITIVDIDRGFAVFGSSGAVLVTVLTGLALQAVLTGPDATPAVTRSPAAPGA